MATRDGAASSCGPNGGLIAEKDATRVFHEPIVLAEVGTNSPGQQPDIELLGTTVVAEFTLNTDSAYRTFKIPNNFVGNPAFHVHWTKETGIPGDNDEDGNTVLWQITYTVFAGEGTDLNVAGTALQLPDSYTDPGLTTRLTHRTASVPATGFIANYYLGICIEAITPLTGTPLTCEPALVSVDLTYDEYINQ